MSRFIAKIVRTGADGADGAPGPKGADGLGVPSGGTTNQVLAKNSDADNDTKWTTLAAGSGDVVGPSSATDNAITRFDTTTGKVIQDSLASVDDTGVVSNVANKVTGTAGAGYIDYPGQSSNPTAPTAGTVRTHATTNNGFTRLEQDNESTTNVIYGRDTVFIAKNTSGSTIAAGKVVYVTGSTGNVPNIALAKADSSTTLPCVGIVVDSIGNNNFGQVMLIGVINNIDTSAFSTGDRVYVSTTTAGSLQNTRPSGTTGNYVQRVGSVLVSGVGNGSVMVDVAPFVGNMETGTNATTFAANAITATTVNGGTLSGNNSGDQDLSGYAPLTSPQFTSKIGIGTVASNTGIDLLGSLRMANVSTDATNKASYIVARHYLNAEQDVAMMVATSSAAASTVRYGGGSGSYNAATQLDFYTAPDNITTTGTSKMTIASTGNITMTNDLGVTGNITGANLSGTNTGDQTLPTDATIVTTDVTTNNVSTSKHGWFPKLPAPTGKFLKDDMTWATISGGGDMLKATYDPGGVNGQLVGTSDARLSDARTPVAHNQAETTITFTDITTGNASTTSHGLSPKATAPAAGNISVLGIANAETVRTDKALFDATVPSTQTYGDAAATGSVVAARRDHKHAMPATTKDTTAVTGLLRGNGSTIAAGTVGNADLLTTAGDIGGAWKAWTPNWTGLSIGNAVVNALYTQHGKAVICRLHAVFGTTTTYSGTFTVSLPVTSVSYPAIAAINTLGTCHMYDASGTAAYGGTVVWASTTTVQLRVWGSAGAYAAPTTVTSTVPVTFTTSDEIAFEIVYEAA